MNIAMLLEMAADGVGDRIALGSLDGGLSYEALLERGRRAASVFAAHPGANVALVDLNTPAVPIALYGAAIAGKPFVPLNYRLKDEQLNAILRRAAPALVVVDDSCLERIEPIEGVDLVLREDFLASLDAASAEPDDAGVTGEEVAALLFTSGTTGEPKAAVLRHENLTSYIISTVEFMGAEETDCILVCVPPYHIASISGFLSNVYLGRRIVQLPAFDEKLWVAAVRRENVTSAMVVPTMLKRILDVLEADGEGLPSLKALSYGGGVMPGPVIEHAMELLPGVDFVNAYGLTETSSTIALLGPEDHREAMASGDPAVRKRLASVGRPLPSVEIEIRDEEGKPVPAGVSGEVWVRGEQVSGEYLGKRAIRDDGWFPTNDGGHFDDDGFLYVEGRLDDVIVRGGENMSPGEIEDVLLEHPAVADVAVCGIPDEEWGEVVAVALVLKPGSSCSAEEVKDLVREKLRSTRVPEVVEFREELPYNEVGKLLRRVLRQELAAQRS